MNSKFENVLRSSCKCVSQFLRWKNIGRNKSRKAKERICGVEKEFVVIRNKLQKWTILLRIN